MQVGMSKPSGWSEKGLSWWMSAEEEVSSRVVPDSRWCRDMCSSSVTVQRCWRKRDKEEQGLPGRLDDENIHSVGDGKGEWPWRWKGLTSRKGSPSRCWVVQSVIGRPRGETSRNPIDR